MLNGNMPVLPELAPEAPTTEKAAYGMMYAADQGGDMM